MQPTNATRLMCTVTVLKHRLDTQEHRVKYEQQQQNKTIKWTFSIKTKCKFYSVQNLFENCTPN